MSVVAASVHDAIYQRGIGTVSFFLQRQCIRISAQQQYRPGELAADDAGYAGTGDDFYIFYAHQR